MEDKKTEITIHWQNIKHNFVNQEMGKSSKHRLGHKPNNLSQTTPITVNRERLDLKFKQMLERELNKHKKFIRKDMRGIIYLNGKRFYLSTRSAKNCSNDVVNALLLTRLKKIDNC